MSFINVSCNIILTAFCCLCSEAGLQNKVNGLLLPLSLSVLSGLGKIVGMIPGMRHGFLASRSIFCDCETLCQSIQAQMH